MEKKLRRTKTKNSKKELSMLIYLLCLSLCSSQRKFFHKISLFLTSHQYVMISRKTCFHVGFVFTNNSSDFCSLNLVCQRRCLAICPQSLHSHPVKGHPPQYIYILSIVSIHSSYLHVPPSLSLNSLWAAALEGLMTYETTQDKFSISSVFYL